MMALEFKSIGLLNNPRRMEKEAGNRTGRKPQSSVCTENYWTPRKKCCLPPIVTLETAFGQGAGEVT